MADRYFINGGVNANWDTSGNWSATDGGSASGVKPSASDAVFFTANSPSCTVNTAGVGASINFTGYDTNVRTLTMTAGLTISGSVTLCGGANFSIAGASALTVNAAGTLTSNGKTWPNALTFSGAATYTLADNWDVDGLITASASPILSGSQINAGSGITVNNSQLLSGTTNIVLDGAGTLTTGTNATMRNNLTINTSNPTGITFAAQLFSYNTGTLTYTAGTVVTTGSTLANVTIATTFACAGITWNAITLTGGVTVTLNENLNATGLVTLGATTGATVVNGSAINASGGVRLGVTTGSVTGTTTINVKAAGTLDGPAVTSGRIENTININAPSAAIVIDDKFTATLDNLLVTAAGSITTDAGTWTLGGGGTDRRGAMNGGVTQ